jgi:UDP-glucose 4-epimerase
VLGDRTQRKSYLYVQDCIDAILVAMEKAERNVNVLNLGSDEHCSVNDSIQRLSEYLGLKPKLEYTGGDRGWVVYNPFIFLDGSRASALGWKPRLTIQQGVLRTIEFSSL